MFSNDDKTFVNTKNLSTYVVSMGYLCSSTRRTESVTAEICGPG